MTVDEVTSNTAVELYTGKLLFWPDGQQVVVIVLPRENASSREFIYNKLGISPYQFYESLDISINIRKNNSVIKVRSEHEAVNAVKKNEGSIGFVGDFIYYNYRDEVRQLRIK